MKTSVQWLEGVKKDPVKFNRWLSRQHKAETDAAVRIEALAEMSSKKDRVILQKIAKDEKNHAELIGAILSKRGIPTSEDSSSRYYKEVDLNSLTLDELYAAGYFAEGMRLSRIEAIVADPDLDADIVAAFKVILKDETMHEKAFSNLASDSAKQKVQSMHCAGVKALGLVI